MSDRREVTEVAEVTEGPGALRVAQVSLGDGDKDHMSELLILSVLDRTRQSKDLLTVAEREVVALLLEGKRPQEIALRRGTSERTVSNQIQSVYRKYGVRTREELALTLIAGL